jgi:hypothetical protein
MRYLTPEVTRLLRDEGKMAFVAGPRQVGKTTLAKRWLSDAGGEGGYFNWDIDAHRKAILRRPEDFWRDAVGGATRPRLVLDEIHKYPRWKRFLKGLWDAHGNEIEILVTGSGRLDVYQRGGDSLQGRYGLYRLHPFTVGEWLQTNRETVRAPADFWRLATGSERVDGAELGLQRIEAFTGFPEPLVAGSQPRLNRWRTARHRLVLRDDLRDLTRIREMGLVEALVELLPERVGAPLSLNSLREDLGVAYGTVRDWIAALARLYYLFEIRPYAGRLSRALRREGKVYLFDSSAIDDPGARFENIVALHLRKLCDAWTDWGFGEFELWYVRNKEKKETDFLLTDRKRPHALVEAKLSETDPDPSLIYFQERLRAPHALQVVRAGALPRPEAFRGVRVLDAAQFLARI